MPAEGAGASLFLLQAAAARRDTSKSSAATIHRDFLIVTIPFPGPSDPAVVPS
jgi:hypothetical protein